MAAPFEDWYRNLPIVTKLYMTGCVVTTFSVFLEIVHPLQLYLNYPLIFTKWEIWRLITTFLFYDNLNLNFLFHMYFLVRHSRLLEEGSFRGRSADYLYMWIFGSFLLLVLNAILYYTKIYTKMMFLSPSIAFMVVYVWARRNPNMHISFLGLFTFSAPYLPWVILGFGYLFHQSLVYDLMGIFAGHIYFVLEDAYPSVSNRRLLKTPSLLKYLLDPNYRLNQPDQQPQQQQQPQPQQQQQEEEQQEEQPQQQQPIDAQ
ncbi:derlin-2 [Tieghemostelium lacteum]|uniref:Derlin n=1 Tax=Tieghemostelium lacteum TaxID=361077 RepID=A0A152A8M4_TIELA|nr:derlin-2 [Tieghemostelium lacteum]|eukprot:KYR02576.1 derlin-2 [Tieghemostelium lacteum]